ncbi:hypothetical protein V9K67_01230 [Paraflavisolibacter sp. H34]|uniref:hypothetical protein n=1 Tax=Huijunlia imazamoxiresistens TaxID=3127457 RepID=UPI00301B0751
MKVICIDGGRRAEDIGTEPLLQEGAVYLVEGEVYGNTSRGTLVECYKLAGIELPFVYVKNRFILCSSDPEEGEEAQNDPGLEQDEEAAETAPEKALLAC